MKAKSYRVNLLFLVSVLALCSALALENAPLASQTGVDRLLEWAPRSAEMVLVAQGKSVPKTNPLTASLQEMVSRCAMPELGGPNQPKNPLGELLVDSPVRLLAVTRFLNSGHIEGCRLCQLSEAEGPRRYVESHCTPLSGYAVPAWKNDYTYWENYGPDEKAATQYICFPAPDVILVAEDERCFAEVLARSQKVSHEGPPPAIAKYRDQVTLDAALWAIRSEPRQIDKQSPWYGEDPRTPPSASSSICFEGRPEGSIAMRFLGFDHDPTNFAEQLGVKLSKVGPVYTSQLVLTTRDGVAGGVEGLSCLLLLGFRFYI